MKFLLSGYTSSNPDFSISIDITEAQSQSFTVADIAELAWENACHSQRAALSQLIDSIDEFQPYWEVPELPVQRAWIAVFGGCDHCEPDSDAPTDSCDDVPHGCAMLCLALAEPA